MRTALRHTMCGIVMAGMIIAWMATTAYAAGAPDGAADSPKAVFPQPSYEFQTIIEGQEIKHDFIVENRGDAPLSILRIQTD
ncbi:MAG: hypothetical protein VR64_06710 [Desulfatitalea sp. BRH_c12]|nr:MAG: hypothetical protein VR64_06710 [Desulfatitalea sp. BRH_c12]